MQQEEFEIVNTLNALREVNSMIQYHLSQKDVEHNSVVNYKRLKADLLCQLNELLEGYELTLDFLKVKEKNNVL